MYYLVDNINHIIFCWSAKCACTHIKKLFYFLSKNNENYRIHTMEDRQNLPNNLNSYIIIVFIRNPFKRCISGFLDKYKQNGEFRRLWNINIPLTFRNFVTKIADNSSVIESHHFELQFSAYFNSKILEVDNLKVYDINKIDYEYISGIFQKNIPDHLINFKGTHKYTYTNIPNNSLCDIHIDEIIKNKYSNDIQYFFDDNLRNLFIKIYQKDFEYCKQLGFNYID